MNPMYDFIQRNRVIAKIDKAHRSKASSLALDDFDLTTFPKSLMDCHSLNTLFLGHNRLTKLPTDFSQLRNIQHLSLQCNNLDSFPDVLKDLPHLKTLNVSNNPIKELTTLENLTTLEVLWCNSCCLTFLPEAIGNLVRLDTLGFRHNQLTVLPDSICNLTQLRWLTLDDNKLYMLPKDFDKMEQLIHLNLNKNNFNFIPFPLIKLKNLKYLHLQSNEFFSIPENELSLLTHVKVNLSHNPLCQIKDLEQMYPNLILPGTDDPLLDRLLFDSDSSSDDWENSIQSSELNYSATDSDSDDEEVVIGIPKLSKFLVTF